MVILEKRVPGMNETVLERFLSRAKRVAGLQGAVTVLLTTSGELRALNRRFRGQDRATDVLSFPAELAGRRKYAGDVAISAEIAAQSARRLGHSTADEIRILVLHGLLHLGGYDHEADHGRMARQEQRLRQQLKLPVALLERAGAGRNGKGKSNSAAAAPKRAAERAGTRRIQRKARARRVSA